MPGSSTNFRASHGPPVKDVLASELATFFLTFHKREALERGLSVARWHPSLFGEVSFRWFFPRPVEDSLEEKDFS